MYQQPSNRSSRRRRYSADYHNVTGMKLPGLLGLMTNPKLFLGAMIVMGISMLFAILPGFSTGGNTNNASNGQVHQANELPDQPQGTPDPNATGTPQARATPTAVVKRYDTPPSMVIDPSKQYVATIKTAKGDIKIQLDAKDAPQTVNSFVFLARQGYYNDTPFMQLVKNNDGSKFVAQAGDPTCHSGTPCQALGTPGYSIPKETTPMPFSRGAVGMGGSSPTSNGGQFFISFGDYPALNGKYTIFGQVIAGQDVLDKLNLLDLTQADPGQADTILSIDITEA